MTDQPKYNPQIHHRRSIRLRGYDYSQAGVYFITICCHKREHLFGEITNGEMNLNDKGTIALKEWKKLQKRYENIKLDIFQVMPNHIHGIIILNDDIPVGAGFTPALCENVVDKQLGFTHALCENIVNDLQCANDDKNWATEKVAPTVNDNDVQSNRNRKRISDIVGAYKSLVANECLKMFLQNWTNELSELNPAPSVPAMGKLWQRNYHEHIIRDEQSYNVISEYILNNPTRWMDDKFYS